MGEYIGFVDRLVATYGRAQERLELLANDAGMTSAANAAHTDGLHLGYMMGVKENQPTLLREAERLCGFRPAQAGRPRLRGGDSVGARPRQAHAP